MTVQDEYTRSADAAAAKRLSAELTQLRLRCPSLTNQAIARRAAGLAPPHARWSSADGRRLGEWLSGQSVPHHREALLAVVTVLTEHVNAELEREGAPRSTPRLRPDVEHWTQLWEVAQRRSSVPAAQAAPAALVAPAAPAAPVALGILDPLPMTPALAAVAEELAADVRAQVAELAAEITLLSPAPLEVTWSQVSSDQALADGSPALFGALPWAVQAAASRPTEPRARAALADLYGAGGSGRLVILGDPGSGKTGTALLFVLDALARRAACPPEQRGAIPVPMYLRLTTWDPETDTLDEWVLREVGRNLPRWADADRQRDLDALLAAGQVSLVLDGLDELRPDIRASAAHVALRGCRLRVVLLGRSRECASADVAAACAGVVSIRLEPLSTRAVHGYLRRCGLRPEELDSSCDVTNPLAAALARDGWRAGASSTVVRAWPGAPGLAQAALATATRYRPGTGRRWQARQRRQVGTVTRLAARMTRAQSATADWWSLPGLLAGGTLLAPAVALATAVVIAGLHIGMGIVHHPTAQRTFVWGNSCLEMTWQGRLAHDLGAAVGNGLGLGALTGVYVALRLRSAGPYFSADGLGRRAPLGKLTPAGKLTPPGSPAAPRVARVARVARAAAAVAAAAAGGATVAAALWATMGAGLVLARLFVSDSLCAMAPDRFAPATALTIGLRGGALSAGLCAVVMLAWRLRVSRAAPIARRAVIACSASGGLLCLAHDRLRATDGYAGVFLPRDDVSDLTTRLIGLGDGIVRGVELGMVAGLGVAFVGVAIMGRATTSDRRSGSSRLRWPSASPVPVEAVALLAVLALAAVVIAASRVSANPSLPWLAAVAALGATWLLAPVWQPARQRIADPWAVLRDDARFTLATAAAVAGVVAPTALGLSLSPEPAFGINGVGAALRVGSATLMTAAVCGILVASAVAQTPLLKICDAYLWFTAGPGAGITASLRWAWGRGLLSRDGAGVQFRHRVIQTVFADYHQARTERPGAWPTP